jgi:hypothetical protein
MRLKARLFKKGYGLDIEGQVTDNAQDNANDKSNAYRNPDKQDIVPQNTITDSTTKLEELKQIEQTREQLNPKIPEKVAGSPPISKVWAHLQRVNAELNRAGFKSALRKSSVTLDLWVLNVENPVECIVWDCTADCGWINTTSPWSEAALDCLTVCGFTVEQDGEGMRFELAVP